MITIGTWNLENLFRPGSDAGPESEAAYEAKLTALAETITELAPDVLAVQEVGEPEALGDLVDRLDGTEDVPDFVDFRRRPGENQAALLV